jgi:LPS-assembly lipoprotein
MKPKISRRLACLGTLTMLTGCGFQPIYMRTASGKAGPAQRELATVFVGNIPDRPGQVLRQALQERLGDDAGPALAYDLNVTFSISGEGIAVLNDAIATRIRFVGSANWVLVSRDPKRTVLASGNARAVDALNIFDSQYFAADLETETEQRRIAENIATQIATRLGVYFREQAAKQTG